MQLKKIVAAVALAAASVSGFAAGTAMSSASGPVPNSEAWVGFGLSFGGNGTADFTFDPSAAYLNALLTVSGNTLFGSGQVTFSNVQLDGAAFTANGSNWVYTGAVTDAVHHITFDYNVPTGTIAQYTATAVMTAAPVPEPETYAMLLAGLGALGFVARRRQSK